MNLGKESETVEHKRSTSELREIMTSVASMLNKHGCGTLYFGVRPSDGEVVGQDVSEKTLRDISQAFTNRIEPRVYPTVEHLITEDGKSYIRVTFAGDELIISAVNSWSQVSVRAMKFPRFLLKPSAKRS